MSWAPKQPELGITVRGGPKVAAVRSLPCPACPALRLIICQGTANRGSRDKKKSQTEGENESGEGKKELKAIGGFVGLHERASCPGRQGCRVGRASKKGFWGDFGGILGRRATCCRSSPAPTCILLLRPVPSVPVLAHRRATKALGGTVSETHPWSTPCTPPVRALSLAFSPVSCTPEAKTQDFSGPLGNGNTGRAEPSSSDAYLFKLFARISGKHFGL